MPRRWAILAVGVACAIDEHRLSQKQGYYNLVVENLRRRAAGWSNSVMYRWKELLGQSQNALVYSIKSWLNAAPLWRTKESFAQPGIRMRPAGCGLPPG